MCLKGNTTILFRSLEKYLF